MNPIPHPTGIANQVTRCFERGRWTLGLIAPCFYASCIARASRKLNLDQDLLKAFSRQAIYFASFDLIGNSTELHDYRESRIVSGGAEPALPRDRLFLRLLQRSSSSASLWLPEGSFLEKLEQSHKLLRVGAFEEILDQWLDSYVLVSGVTYRSASVPQAFGSIFLADRCHAFDSKTLCISIVHELAHQELFLLNTVDRLIVPQFDFSHVHSPLQNRERPPIGRLHSLFALFRMIQYMKEIGFSAERYREKFMATLLTFGNGELTPFAQNLIAVMESHVEDDFADAEAVTR